MCYRNGAMDRDPRLTAALEAALVRELRATWWQLNESFFRDALRPPTMHLVLGRHNLGRWMPATRTIEMSRPLLLERAWGVVVEVLKHEMAHQYVHEVLGETDQAPHGRAFQEACARLGVDARASGVPEVQATAAEDRVVERIARLLALAESPNRHEAEAAMAVAQRLMLKHNLDASRDRKGAARDYAFLHLGEPTGRVAEHERLVAMILGKYFFVEAIWIPVYRPLAGKRGSVLELCGTSANLAIADYVHGFLPRHGRPPLGRPQARQGHPGRPRAPHFPRRRHGGLRGPSRTAGGRQPRRGPRVVEGRGPFGLLPPASPVRAACASRGAAANGRVHARARRGPRDRAAQAGGRGRRQPRTHALVEELSVRRHCGGPGSPKCALRARQPASWQASFSRYRHFGPSAPPRGGPLSGCALRAVGPPRGGPQGR